MNVDSVYLLLAKSLLNTGEVWSVSERALNLQHSQPAGFVMKKAG
jgi:hypothetical protein